MLLIDFNQIVIANIMVQHKSVKITDELIRYCALNSLRYYIKKFKNEYPETVICTDARNSWRYEFFPYYKGNRRITQDASKYDWKMIHDTIGTIRTELMEHFPHKVLQVDRAEADDIIAVLTLHSTEPTLIISSDKDFLQLQWKGNVRQYSPKHEDFIACEDPTGFLRDHIIRGDASDGIPNILSEDTSFVFKTRQKVLTQTRLENAQWALINDDLGDLKANYIRNKTLIDLESIPKDLEDSILEHYRTAPKRNKQKLLNYFIKYRLSGMSSEITDF